MRSDQNDQVRLHPVSTPLQQQAGKALLSSYGKSGAVRTCTSLLRPCWPIREAACNASR